MMIPALGLLHIGRTAYCVWAYPPNVRGAAQGRVPIQRRTTVASRTTAGAMLDTGASSGLPFARA